MTTNEKIKKIRKERGLTQKQLGLLSGINEVQIRQYELGKANPKLDTIKKIAYALNVTISELFPDNWDEAFTDEVKKDFTLYDDLRNKLSIIGYSIGAIESEGYLWINYPDGSLEITEDELRALDEETDQYLKFKLEQLKQLHIKDFKKK